MQCHIDTFQVAPLEIVDAIALETYKFRFDLETTQCVHCGESTYDYYDLDAWPYGFADFAYAYERVAANTLEVHGLDASHPHVRLRGAIDDRQSSLHICLVAPGALMELDVTDMSAPLGEVRRFLRRRYDARRWISPGLLERVVASVFQDLGYRAEATAYSNDGGIDIVLRDTANRRIGVQVKRRGRAIEVEQIRAFLGALMIGGFAKGIFLSTSGFQRGAVLAANACHPWASVELVDAQHFFDALGIAQMRAGIDPVESGFYDTGKPPIFLHSALHLSST